MAMKILQIVVGFIILVGSAAVWNYWHIDGFMAFVVALAGVSLIGRAFGLNLI